MSRYEHRRFSAWQKWVVQLSLAAAATSTVMAISEYIGADNVRSDITQQQEWDRLREAADMKRTAEMQAEYAGMTSNGKPVIPIPDLVITYPERPIEPMQAAVRQDQESGKGYGWAGLFSLFVAASTITAGLVTREKRSAEPETSELKLPEPLNYDPVPPAREIDQQHIGTFEPTVYYGSNYGSQVAELDQMLDTYQPTFMERAGQRIAGVLARRRERLREQLEVQMPDDLLHVPVTNYIEPVIAFDAA